MRARTYIRSMDPVQSSLGMHEGNPIVRKTITGNEGKYVHDVPPLSAKTHRTKCVVTGGKTQGLITLITIRFCFCFSYLSIPIIGRSLSPDSRVGNAGPKLTVTLW